MKKIAIFGVPRSGTSWLSQIFNSNPDVVLRFQPLFSFEHKNRLTPHSSLTDINGFFYEILNSSDDMALMKSKVHKDYPEFNKSDVTEAIVFKETRYLNLIDNILIKDQSIKIIGIVRHPLATIASWYQAPKEFDSSWNVFEEWENADKKNKGRIEEFYGFSKWMEITKKFIFLQSKYPSQFKIIKYSELNNNTEDMVKDLFEFVSLDFSYQTKEFILQSKCRHDDDPYSVYRSKANDESWKTVLPKEISDEILIQVYKENLQEYLS
jgi:hypothetical protein